MDDKKCGITTIYDIAIFIENGFDSLDIIEHITMNDLTAIGIDKLGHRVKIAQEIVKLNQPQNQSLYQGPAAYI